MDLRLNLGRLENIVEDVERHIAAGKLDSAALVLGVSTSKIDGPQRPLPVCSRS